MDILKRSISLGLFAAFAIGSAPISAQAEEISARGPIPFATYDEDGNGFISEDEFNTVRGKRMATKAAEGRPMSGVAGAPAFSTFDTNGDGQLSREELATGQKAQMEKRREMGMGQGSGAGQGMGQGMGRNMPAFSEYDLNGDGKIVESEFNEARSKRISERAQQGYQMRNLANAPLFSDIDTNGDGAISTEEFAVQSYGDFWCMGR